MQLNTFVTRYVPTSIRQGRDFDGPNGWCFIMNELLHRLEMEGLVKLDQRKEVGVLVENDYWITIPSDLRSVVGINYPDFDKMKPLKDVGHKVINGKIKIDTAITTYDSDLDEFTLSSGDTDSVIIDDDDATENQWEDYLLVLTDGTYSGDKIIIGEHDAASGGYTTLNFMHDRSTSISDSTAGYLTNVYMILDYMAKFTELTAEDDEIPISDMYESVLSKGLCYLGSKITSDERKAYREEFEFDLNLLKDEQFTPSENQARPQPRPIAGLEDCSEYYENHTEFVGDTDAWLE